MNAPPLPPGVTIGPPPPELKFGVEDYPWNRLCHLRPDADDNEDDYRYDPTAEARKFPEPFTLEP